MTSTGRRFRPAGVSLLGALALSLVVALPGCGGCGGGGGTPADDQGSPRATWNRALESIKKQDVARFRSCFTEKGLHTGTGQGSAEVMMAIRESMDPEHPMNRLLLRGEVISDTVMGDVGQLRLKVESVDPLSTTAGTAELLVVRFQRAGGKWLIDGPDVAAMIEEEIRAAGGVPVKRK